MKLKLRIDIPIKYELGAHRLLPEYPDAAGVLFDIAAHLAKKSGKKTFKPSIQPSTLKDVLPMDDKKEQVKSAMRQLHQEGALAFEEGSIRVTDKGFETFYTIE